MLISDMTLNFTGIAIKKSPNSDSSFESRLLDEDDDPMCGGAAPATTQRPTSGENTASKTGALTETPTGPRSKKVSGYFKLKQITMGHINKKGD